MSLSPLELTERLKAEARRLGFDLVGVAQARPLDAGFYRDWLAAGHAADLGYMKERVDERLDPGRLVPGARSVIALAVNYYRPDADPPGGNLAGGLRIARYARGRDYHLFLRRKTRKLRNRLLALAPGARVHPSVDTSPVAEKIWAELAGLGWVGHNGLLITPRFGSWVLLATLITDLELAFDSPHPHRCGGCRACLPACPTAAILGDGRIDARRCLANWTIETRGPIPEPIRDAAAQRHFGCDLCQEVCPWNRSPTAAASPDFDPFPVVRLRCSALLEMSESELAPLLAGSPLKRPGLSGFRRNAVLGLATEGGAQARSACARLSADPDPVLRSTAEWVGRRLAAGDPSPRPG
jgi:epoxyqueuosine reductase